MRVSRMFTFGALLLAMAVGGAVIAGADHTTLTIGDGPFGTDGSYHYTLAAGESNGLSANNGGVVRCPEGTFANKIEEEDLANGVYPVGDGYIEIYDYDGKSFSWEIVDGSLDTIDANTIIVKGGPASEIYVYPSVGGLNYADYDVGLTAPENPKNGKRYGISHISFCFDPKA